MTGIDLPNADLSTNQWKSICTHHEQSLSILATKKRDLEIRNDELARINTSLNANYQVLQQTLSELSANKTALVTRNTELQNSLDYLCEISGYGDLVQRQKVDKQICVKSRDRNRVVGARIPVQKEDVHATTTTTSTATPVALDDRKHSTRSLDLCCDCGTTFKVTGDNLASIRVKHGTSTTKSCRRQDREAKNRTNAPGGAQDHNASLEPLTPTSLRSGSKDPDILPGMDALMSLILLGLVFMICCFTGGPKKTFG